MECLHANLILGLTPIQTPFYVLQYSKISLKCENEIKQIISYLPGWWISNHIQIHFYYQYWI
jgi:hypothetical protein